MKTGRYLRSVRGALPESAQGLLDEAFAGNALAARRLMITAPRRLRGHIAFLAYQLKIPNPAYREIVRVVWAKDARQLLTDFWRPHVIRRMLARAEFRTPLLSGPVTIFRAASGQRKREAAAGLCWSTSPEAALCEASGLDEAKPRLLQATIDPADIIYWRNSHGDHEVVGRHPVKRAVQVDPSSFARNRPPIATRARGYRAASHH